MRAAPPPPTDNQVVVGIDFGTLSARAVVVQVADGAELGVAVSTYAHGVLDRALPDGAPLPPDWALQVPSDYIEVLRSAVPEAVASSGVRPEDVIGIGTAFTACTVLPVLADGTPLCEVPGLANRPHAYVKLWKHHAAQLQADRINVLAHERAEKWIGRYGNRLSCEWELAKGLELLEEEPELYDLTAHWVEAADWIVWRLCGTYVRNACTAGYKAVLQDGQYPSDDFLSALDPRFATFFRDKVHRTIAPLGARAGVLTAQAAAWTGLPPGIPVCVGNVDAHVTAPAARATRSGQLLAVLGTSTCHVMSSSTLAEVPGMCGVVDGGIVPELWGYEAGQSGVGDILGWFVDNAVPAALSTLAEQRGVSLHTVLSELASEQRIGAHGLIALDWHSGNRSVLVDHDLSGLVLGLTLQTRPEDVYRALVEATAFGTRMIVEAFETAGVDVIDFVAAGGLTSNAFLMQIYADVLRRPISVIGSDQGPALGAAIYAAVAAGAWPDITAAAEVMGKVQRDVWRPDAGRADAYDAVFAEYTLLHDYFGRGANEVMHRLRAMRRTAVTS